MITNIYRASGAYATLKKDKIQSARENIETIRLFLRLLKDLQQISLVTFVKLNTPIESVSKQLSAWQKSL